MATDSWCRISEGNVVYVGSALLYQQFGDLFAIRADFRPSQSTSLWALGAAAAASFRRSLRQARDEFLGPPRGWRHRAGSTLAESAPKTATRKLECVGLVVG